MVSTSAGLGPPAGVNASRGAVSKSRFTAIFWIYTNRGT
jgi:hypothetical protein